MPVEAKVGKKKAILGQQDLLETILEANPGGIAVLSGKELKFVFTNPAYRKLIPHPIQNLQGITFDEAWPPAEGFTQRPILQRVLQSGEAIEIERQERRYPDGSLHTFSFKAQRIFWEGRPAVLDILWETTALENARKEAEQLAREAHQAAEKLEGEQARLQIVIQNAPEAIVMVDAHGKVMLANPSAEELFGKHLAAGEGMGRFGTSLYHVDGSPYRPGELPLMRAARQGEKSTNVEMVLLRPDGARQLVACSAAPILDRGKLPTGAVAVFQDITQRKRAEENARREAARMELLASLSQAFAEAGLYYPAVLGTISRRASEAIGDACVIRMISDDGRWLDPVAFHHVDPEALMKYRIVLNASRKPVGEMNITQSQINGRPLVWLDLTNEDLKKMDRYQLSDVEEGNILQNALLVPLRAQGRFIGTLTVVRTQSATPFTLEDQAFVQDLADRAALAIDNARLYAAETTRSRELEALHKAATALLGNLDLDNLLDQILETAREAIPSTEKGLLHLADASGELKVRGILGFRHPRIEKASENRNGFEFLTRAIRERQPELVREIQPPIVNGRSQGPRSAIVAPLILGQRVLGVLSLTSSRVGAFTDSDLRLLISLAATATAAIQNARLHSEVQRLAVTDDLTSLFNRRGFFELGERELERFHRFGRPLSAIMMDVDHFKEVNDTFGHAAGDQVLATVARRARAHIRQVDVLGRYGGEEFAILLPETGLQTAVEVAERIRNSISGEPVMTSEGPVTISVSLGVCESQETTKDLADFLQKADLALYKAKQNGRDRVEV